MLRVRGFTSAKAAHAHLLKHVLRVTEQADPDSTSDPESWHELISDPPLIADVPRRQQASLAVLREVTACPAGETGVTADRPCDRCQNARAISVITSKMQPHLSAYTQVGQDVVNAAFRHPDRSGPRLVAYRRGPHVVLETIDSRHMRVVGHVDANHEVALATCYRDRRRSLKSNWLELARLRATHRRNGTLVTLPEARHVDA
jgi:hypothetical protein